MPSLQSRLMYLMMKNRHLMRGQWKQAVWDENTSVQAFRDQCEADAAKAPMPEGVAVQPVKIEGLPEGLKAEWLVPEGAPQEPVIFYCHGGGYISGSCSDHRALVGKLAKGAGMRLLLYEYRLAPEHPFPAAVEDTLTAYRWLLRQGIEARNIVISGESAGGGLALAALLAFRDTGLPLPAAAAVMSPMTDLTLSGESHRTRVKQCLSPLGMENLCCKYYAGDTDLKHPWISPLYGDLRGMPPLMIVAGDYETFRDDAVLYAEKAKAAGVDTTLRIGPEMVHVFPLMAPFFPEATAQLEEICAFIKQHAYGAGIADALGEKHAA